MNPSNFVSKAPSLPWYQKWFDLNYLLLYPYRDKAEARTQFELIRETLKPRRNWKILDLACGEGRYCALFRDAGYSIFGLDLSPVLIHSGFFKYGPMNLMVGDMRCIPGRYHLILSLFTSFGYFLSDGENESVLAAVQSALKPNGWLWLDFFNPAYVKRFLEPETRECRDNGLETRICRRLEGKRIIKDIVIKKDSHSCEYQESVCLYEREELENMLKKFGLEPQGCCGDYGGSPWNPASPRTILYARKKK